MGASFRTVGGASLVGLVLTMASCDLVHTLGQEPAPTPDAPAPPSDTPAPPADEPADAGSICTGKTCNVGYGCHPTTGECAPLCAPNGPPCASGTYCDRGVCLYGSVCTSSLECPGRPCVWGACRLPCNFPAAICSPGWICEQFTGACVPPP